MSFTLALGCTDSRFPDVGEVCLGVGFSHIPPGWGWLRPSLHIGSRQLLKPVFDWGAHQIPYENRSFHSSSPQGLLLAHRLRVLELLSQHIPQHPTHLDLYPSVLMGCLQIIAALASCPAQCRHGMKGINQGSTLSSTSVKRPLAFFTEQVPWRWGVRLYKQRPILCLPFTSLYSISMTVTIKLLHPLLYLIHCFLFTRKPDLGFSTSKSQSVNIGRPPTGFHHHPLPWLEGTWLASYHSISNSNPQNEPQVSFFLFGGQD